MLYIDLYTLAYYSKINRKKLNWKKIIFCIFMVEAFKYGFFRVLKKKTN